MKKKIKGFYPVCPECREVIKYLDYVETITQRGVFKKNKRGQYEMAADHKQDEAHGDASYFCPHCSEEITDCTPDEFMDGDCVDENDDDEWCIKCGKSGEFPEGVCPKCSKERKR